MDAALFVCKVLVFDWDGTLLDSVDYKKENLALVFSEAFDVDREKVQKMHDLFSGIPRRDLFQKIAHGVLERNLEDDEFLRLSNQFTLLNEQCSPMALLFPDVRPCLQFWHDKKIPLFVSSSSPEGELNEVVKNKGIRHYFDGVLGSRKNFSKGQAHFAEISKRTGMGLEGFVFVGDTMKDLELAKNTGVKSYRIQREQPEPLCMGVISGLEVLRTLLIHSDISSGHF